MCSLEASPRDAVLERALPGTKLDIPSSSVWVDLFYEEV